MTASAILILKNIFFLPWQTAQYSAYCKFYTMKAGLYFGLVYERFSFNEL
jgi:hypothetical protein